MSLNSTRIALFNYFNNNWSGCDIVFDGQKTGDAKLKQTDPWLYTYISWDEHIPRSHGNSTDVYFTTAGILAIKLYVRETDGVAAIDILTDSLFTLFHSRSIDNIILSEVQVLPSEPFQDWNLRFINIPFHVQTFENIS